MAQLPNRGDVTMPSRYSIIRYVPDPIAEEQVNFGVVAFDGTTVKTRFVTNWSRLASFGGEDSSFLREFADALADGASRQLPLFLGQSTMKVDETVIKRMIGTWKNCIQFSDVRTSLKAPSDLVDEVAPRFLRNSSRRKQRGATDARLVSAEVRRSVRSAAVRVFDAKADKLLEGREIKGRFQSHRFDAIVSNGAPYLAAHALSFDMRDAKELRNAAEAAAWSISDVRASYSKLPIAMYMSHARPGTATFERREQLLRSMKLVYKKLKAHVFVDGDLERWAYRVLSGSRNRTRAG
jgi:hypothetical protein